MEEGDEEQQIKKLIEKSKDYADKEDGLKLNPDEKIVRLIVKGLLANKEKHGDIYCPCRMVTEDEEENKRIVCPCAYHKEEIKTMGHCHCNLFVSDD